MAGIVDAGWSRVNGDRSDGSSHSLALLTSHLERYANLSEEDRRGIGRLPVVVRNIEKGRYLAREGEMAAHYIMLLSGQSCRYKLTFQGARQIISLQMAGEAVSSASMLLDEAGTSTQALSRVRAAFIPGAAFRQLIGRSSAIQYALLIIALIEGSISNEWLLNIGRRSGKARVAHLLCEIASRLDAIGHYSDSYAFFLTQDQIGDLLGLTSIHVNRMLKELRSDGLLKSEGRVIILPRRKDLEQLAGFSENYLHIPRGLENSRRIALHS